MLKKENFTICTNYWGISLTHIAAKAYNRMILNIIRPVIDSLLRPTQNSLRPAWSTSSHVLGLRIIAAVEHNHNKVALIISIAFKKAFDSFERKKDAENSSRIWNSAGDFERYQSYVGELLSICNDTRRQHWCIPYRYRRLSRRPLGSISFCYMPWLCAS